MKIVAYQSPDFTKTTRQANAVREHMAVFSVAAHWHTCTTERRALWSKHRGGGREDGRDTESLHLNLNLTDILKRVVIKMISSVLFF